MAIWKPLVAKINESKSHPIKIEEDSPARLLDSPPPIIPQQHQTKSGEAYFDGYIIKFDDHQQLPFFDEGIYQNQCKNSILVQENPSLCYDKEKEETQEREELFRYLKKQKK